MYCYEGLKVTQSLLILNYGCISSRSFTYRPCAGFARIPADRFRRASDEGLLFRLAPPDTSRLVAKPAQQASQQPKPLCPYGQTYLDWSSPYTAE